MKRPWFNIVCELDTEARPAPTIRDIQRAVCGRFAGITVTDIISDRRTDEMIMPRHVAMYLAKKLTLKSYTAIAVLFGDRDYTTIMDGCKKIERLARDDSGLAQLIQSVGSELGFAT